MTMWPKGLLLVALLGAALGDGIPDDVEVVTSTSVSVRVSTSEDHIPRESIINQIVEKDEDSQKSDVTKKDVTIREDQKTTLQGQSITVKATTESPKYRVRQKGTSSATTVTVVETTTPTTTSAPSTEPPKDPPRRKRKRPAGYRRPDGLPARKRPEEERRVAAQARPHPIFPQPGAPHPGLPQHVELNRQHQQQPTPRPQYQSPLPRVPDQLPHHPPAHQAPLLKRLPVPALQPQHSVEKTEPAHHPQVRPRPVVFEPQLHQPLPLPQPHIQQGQRQVSSIQSVPLPTTVSHHHDVSTSVAPEQPSTKKPLKLKKHRAPEAQKRPQQTQITSPTSPPPTRAKVAAAAAAATTTPAKSSFLSYFSFGKKDEKLEVASTPLPPVSAPVPAPAPVQPIHAAPVPAPHVPQVRPHYQAEQFQPGPVELSFRESAKQQKFPKTTKTHKPQKNTKKHFREDYPIPPVVPIPPPRYDEPYRPLESSQPPKSTPSHTSYTAPPPPPPPPSTPSEPVQTTYSAPVETQKPHHHAPNYTPPPPSQPQFIFGYQQDQAYQPAYQQAQPHAQQYSQPIYSQPVPPQYQHPYSTYQSAQPHHEQSYQQQPQQQQQHQALQQTYQSEPQGRPQGHYQQSASQNFHQGVPQSFQQGQRQQSFQQDQRQQGFQQHSHQQSYEQPQALLVQVPNSVNPGQTQIELPAEMLKALGVKNVAPGVSGSADDQHHQQGQAAVVSHLSNGQGVVVLDELSNRPYVRPNSEVTYHHHQGFHGDPVPVDVSKTPFTKGLPHGFPAPSKILVDEKTQVSLSGVVLPHHGLKTTYNELPPTQVNLNEPLNVHIPISQLPPRPAVNVRIKGPNGKVSEVLVPLHESNIKRFPHVGGYPNLAEKPKKYLSPFYGGGSSHGKHIQHSFVDQQEFGAHSTPYIRYAQPVQETLQTAASTPQASWIGGWGTSIRNMGSRIGSIFSRKASSS